MIAFTVVGVTGDWTSTATRPISGTSSVSNSNRFSIKSTAKKERPVTLPSGLPRLATKPAATMSPATVTMGMSLVNRRALIAAVVPIAAITSGRDAIASFAIPGNSAASAIAERCSMVIVAPGTYPNARRPSSRARACSGGDPKLSTTIRCLLAADWASAASGAARRAPGIIARKVRRSITARCAPES